MSDQPEQKPATAETLWVVLSSALVCIMTVAWVFYDVSKLGS